MDYSLLLLLLLASPNYADDASAQNRRNLSDSFAVNIGAGYGVGIDHSTSNLPRSTTRINGPRTLREPRTLNNFFPQPNMMRQLPASQNRIFNSPNFEYYPPAHSSFNGNHYGVHEDHREEDNKDIPSMLDVQNVLNGVSKPYSKILQVIKVPAIYEIHLQSDQEKGHQGSFSKLKLAQNENFYLENKPTFTRTKLSDAEYNEWLSNYYKKREESFGLGKYSSIPKLPQGNLDDMNWDVNKMNDNEILPPILDHHYNHLESKFDSAVVNFKPTWQKNQFGSNIYPNNIKRDIGLKGVYSNNKPKFPLNKKFSDKTFSLQKPSQFLHDQEITNSDQPQALHEVPAPYLGKGPKPKQFDVQPATPATTFSFEDKSKFNDFYHKPTASTDFFSHNQGDKTDLDDINKPEAVPSSEHFASFIKGNQNLIYGKATEPVLSPYEHKEAPHPVYTPNSIHSEETYAPVSKASEANNEVITHENSPGSNANLFNVKDVSIIQKADKNVYENKPASNEVETEVDIEKIQLWEPLLKSAPVTTESPRRRVFESDKMFRKNPYAVKKPYGRKGRLDYIVYITKKSTEDN